MATKVSPVTFTPEELIQVIKTGVPGRDGLGKMRALAAFRRTDSPRKVEVFSELLADQKELPRFRHMAALGLYEIGGKRAEQALLDFAPRSDPLTAPTIALALGRIGSRDAIPALRRLRATASEASKASVDFSLTLLAYRNDLAGQEVKLPADNQMLEISPDSESIEIKVSRAPEAEAKIGLEALKQEPVDVDLAPETAQQIVCPPNTFLFLWSRQFAGPRIREFLTSKGVMGVLLLRSRFEDAYSLAAFALGTPSSSGVLVTVHRSSNGQIEYAGVIDLSGTQAQVEVRTARLPGRPAITFRGSIDNGQFVMRAAQSALVAPERRLPRPDPEIA